MAAVRFSGLGWAIQSRLLVHAALDRDDMRAVIELNRVADAAYDALSTGEQRLYREWVRPFAEQAIVEMGEALAALPGEDA